MSLMSALNSALTGLRANQASIDLVSRNVTNADTPGYTRKVMPRENIVLDGQGAGVRTLEVQRQLDLRVQAELLAQRATSNKFDVVTQFLSRVDEMFGRPENEDSVAAAVKRLTTSLQELADTPESASVRQSALDAADNLARDLNGMTDRLQTMRLQAEQGIGESVDTVNDALRNIDRLNVAIASRAINGQSTADLEDERDVHVAKLSAEMNVKFLRGERGKLSVFTESGRTLVDGGVNEVLFEPASSMTARSGLANGTVGRLTLANSGEDLLARGEIRAGNIAGYVAIRDEHLPQAQAQLDELAHALATGLYAETHTVAAGGATATLSLENIGRVGDRIVIEYRDAASQLQQVVLTAVAGAPGAGEFDISGDDDATLASIGAALAAPLGFAPVVPGSKSLTIQVTAPIRLEGVRSYTEVGLGVELFRDTDVNGQSFYGDLKAPNYTSVPVADQKTGFAGRIAVSADLLADTTRLVRYQTRPPGATDLNAPVMSDIGSGTRALDLVQRLTVGTYDFAAATGIGGGTAPYNGTIESFAINVVSYQAGEAAGADDRAGYELRFTQTLETRFEASSAVDINDELAQMIVFENAYGASARIFTTVQAMLDELMDIVR